MLLFVCLFLTVFEGRIWVVFRTFGRQLQGPMVYSINSIHFFCFCFCFSYFFLFLLFFIQLENIIGIRWYYNRNWFPWFNKILWSRVIYKFNFKKKEFETKQKEMLRKIKDFLMVKLCKNWELKLSMKVKIEKLNKHKLERINFNFNFWFLISIFLLFLSLNACIFHFFFFAPHSLKELFKLILLIEDFFFFNWIFLLPCQPFFASSPQNQKTPLLLVVFIDFLKWKKWNKINERLSFKSSSRKKKKKMNHKMIFFIYQIKIWK